MTDQNRYLPWAIFLGVLVVYLCFPTRNYYWDGLAFAMDIEEAGRLSPSLLHQNHLVYNVLGYVAYRLARLAGAQVRAVQVLQALNSVLSAACALVLFRILREAFRSEYLAGVLALLFAFSATWWRFSTDADSYIPSTLLLLLCFQLLLPGRRPRPLLVAALHTAAMLLHQLAVFFYPAAVVGLLLQAAGTDRRAAPALRYTAAAPALTLAAYYLCFGLRTGGADPVSFVKWIATYSSGEGGFTFDVLKSLTFTLRGHVRLFLGGRVNILADFINPAIVALLVLLFAAFALLAYKLVRHAGELRPFAASVARGFGRAGPVGTLALIWAAPYLVFCFFFYPQDTFHRLVYFPALVLLAGAVLAGGGAFAGRPRRWRAALAVTVLALSNFLFLTYPYSHVRANTPLALALDMRREWSDETVVYYGVMHSDAVLLKYFNPSTAWRPVGHLGTGELEEELRKVYSGGGSAWVETSGIDRIARMPDGARWLAANTEGEPAYELTDPAYRLKVMRISPR